MSPASHFAFLLSMEACFEDSGVGESGVDFLHFDGLESSLSTPTSECSTTGASMLLRELISSYAVILKKKMEV